MKTSENLKKWLFLGLTVFLFSGLQGQDWPGWRGENRDARVS
jgi:hypothetical protein